MRIRTKMIAENHVRHSYYVSLLRWLGERLWTHAENVVDRRFAR